MEFKVKGLGCSLPLMPDRDAVSMQPAWEQNMWLDREKGFNHFLALFLWQMEMNPCMKVQEAKWRTGKGSGCNLQLTLTTPAQKEMGNFSGVGV